MKGLLLKDLYMIRKYCWSYLMIIVLFTVILAISGNPFYGLFPCLLVGALPSSIQAYDEKERWLQYSGTLPVMREQIVSVKYICGIGLIVIQALISAAVLTLHMLIAEESSFTFGSIALFCSIYPLIGAGLSFCLPFVFRLGAEKGRYAYMVFGGLVGASGAILATYATADSELPVFDMSASTFALCAMLIAAAALLYAISWTLSIAMYKKREI